MATMPPLPELSPEVSPEALATVEVQPGATDAQAVFWTAYELARAIRRAEGTLHDPDAELDGDRWYEAVCDWAEVRELPEKTEPDDLWSEILIHWARSHGRHRDPLRAAADALNAAIGADALPKIPGVFPLAHRKTIALCHALAEANADREGVFFLSARTLGERIGKSHEGARKDLNALVAQGWIIFVEDPHRAFNDAYSYRLAPKLTQYLSISKSQILRDTPISDPPAAITRDVGIAAQPEAEPEPALAEIGAAAALALGLVQEGERAKATAEPMRAVAGKGGATTAANAVQAVQAVQAEQPDPAPDPAEFRPEGDKTRPQNGPRAAITPPAIPTPHRDPVRTVEATERACRRAVQAGRMTARAAFDETADTLLAAVGRPGDPEARRAVWRMRHDCTPWPEVVRRLMDHYRKAPTTPVITRRDHDHPRDHDHGYSSAVERGYRLYCT